MLTQAMGALTREIRTAHDARAVALSKFHKVTRTQLARFTEERKRLAARERADLAQARTELASRDDARHALAMRQRADLDRSEARRRTGVRAWMQPLTADRVAAHKTWRSRAAAMRGRGAAAATATAGSPAAGQAAPVEPAEVATGEEGASAGVAGGAGATDALHRRVLDHLSSHPEGSRLTELEQRFGMGRLHLARAVKALMDHGRVEKREFLYFASSSASTT